MKKQKFSAVLAVVAAVGVASAALTACSAGGKNSAASTDNCTPANPGLTTVADGALTVGVPENLPYTKTAGKDAEGFEIDLVREIAAAECLSLVFTPITYGNGIPMVSEQRSVDLITGGWYVTEDRAKQVGFSSPTFYDSMAIISQSGTALVSDLETLSGVGSAAGFSWEADMTRVLGDKLQTYPGTVEIKQDVVNGRLEAALDGYAVATAAYADTDFKVAVAEPDDRVAITTDMPMIAFPVAKDNSALAETLSSHIDAFREDGTLAEILAGWDLPTDLLIPADKAATSIR